MGRVAGPEGSSRSLTQILVFLVDAVRDGGWELRRIARCGAGSGSQGSFLFALLLFLQLLQILEVGLVLQ